MFFGGDSIEVLRVVPAAQADLAGASLDSAGVQTEERLFSSSGEGAEVTL